MTLGRAGYRDTATYWPTPRETGYGGVEFDAPKVILTKWEDRVEQFIDFRGEELRSASIVYVMEDLDEGGYLALGDFTSTLDPSELKDAYFIKRVDKIRDLRGLHEEITVYL